MLNENEKIVPFFPGSEQVWQITRRLHQLAENNQRMLGQQLRLPALLILTDEGADLNNSVMNIVRQLKQDKLIRFACPEPVILYKLRKDGNINQLLDKMDSCSGFNCRYTGCVVVQLGNDLFANSAVMENLSLLVEDQQGQAMFIFTAAKSIPARQLNDIIRRLSGVTPLETVEISAPMPDKLAEYFEQQLLGKGFSLTREARKALPDCISEWMQKNKACVTVSGINALRDKAIFNIMSSRPLTQQKIQLDDLRMISSNGQVPDAGHERRTIGF